MKNTLVLFPLFISILFSNLLISQSVQTLADGNRLVEIVDYKFPKNLANMPEAANLRFKKEKKGIKVYSSKNFNWSPEIDVDWSNDFIFEAELKPTGEGVKAKTAGIILGQSQTSRGKKYLLLRLNNEGICDLSWMSKSGRTSKIFKYVPSDHKMLGEYKFLKTIKGYRKVKIVQKNGFVQIYLNNKKIKNPIKANLQGNAFSFYIRKDAPLRLRSFKIAYLLDPAPTLAISPIKFQDDNLDGSLNNSEPGILQFRIKNIGSSNAKQINLSISSNENIIFQDVPTISDLKPGEEKEINLSIEGQKSLIRGVQNLVLTAKESYDSKTFTQSISINTLPVNPVSFELLASTVNSSVQSDVFEAFAQGKLSFTIKNKGDLNCRDCKWELKSSNASSNISFAKMNGKLQLIKPKAEQKIEIPWTSGMNELNSQIKLELLITKKDGTVVLNTNQTVDHNPFVKTTQKVTRNTNNKYQNNASRKKAIDYLKANPRVNYNSFKSELLRLSKQGDPYAKAWVADLSNVGFWFFRKDRDLANQLGEQSLTKLLNIARSGEPEAIYLSGSLIYYGIGTPRQEEGKELIALAAKYGYAPANYLLANIEMKNNPQKAAQHAQNAIEKGFVPAYSILGQIYKNSQPKKAINQYQQGVTKKDPYCMLLLANMYLNGEQIAPDVNQAIKYYEMAYKTGYLEAANNLGLIYLSGEMGKAKDTEKAYTYFKEAATAGNVEAMFMLGLMDLQGLRGYKDLNSGKYWLTEAAENNHAPSMALLGKYYASTDMEQTEQNQVLSRFWTMEAKIRGEEVGSTGGEYNLLGEVLNNTQWTTTVTTTKYSNGYTTQSESPNIVSDVLGGLFSTYMKAQYSNDKLNAATFIQKSGNQNIYAASLNNKTATPIIVRPGQKIQILGRGKVILGGFAGSHTASGSADPSLRGYNRVSHYNHGALMYKIGESGKWQLAGKNKILTATESGTLYLALNDRKTSDNHNYFDVKIVVE